ncbi:MAG: SIMPL domain-containing protein [Pseudomonadota bacterium]
MSFKMTAMAVPLVLATGLIVSACGGATSTPTDPTPTASADEVQVSAASELMPTVVPNAAPIETYHPNAIQPETTISLMGKGEVTAEPDIAIMSAGVRSDAATAAEAMAENRTAMNAVFDALKAAGVADRDMQTSNFSLQPQYDYSNRSDGEPPRLTGYRAGNELSVRVRDLDQLGAMMDALVSAGSNTFSGVQFALDDPRNVRNEARRLAIRDAISKAELYAAESGYTVARIVTLSESGGYQPVSMQDSALSRVMAESTPIAAGEVGYTINVNVLFELRQADE